MALANHTLASLFALAGAVALSSSPASAEGGGSDPSIDSLMNLKPQVSPNIEQEILPFDLTGDGAVTATDLAILLAQWGSSGPGDLNSDGVVGPADLAIFMANWYIAPQQTFSGELQIDLKCAPSDLNSDGVVEAFDVAILLASWGKNSRYDLTGDGIVGPADLAELLANWSPDARVPDPTGTGASFFDVDRDKQFTINDIISTMAQFGRDGSADLNKDGDVDQLDMIIILDGWYTVDFEPYVEPENPASFADISGDGVVGPIDLVLLLLEYGAQGKSPADLDGNGSVGSEDLAMLLSQWE